MPALVARPIADAASLPEVDALLLGALIDLSLGRIDQATETFVLTVEREPSSLSSAQLRFVRALARHDKLSPVVAGRVLGPLKRRSPDLEELEASLPLMFCLALRAHDTQTAISIIDRALIVDEQTYLAGDASVAEAISQGGVASALDHFIRAGGEPVSDASFRLLREVKTALHTLLGVDVPITSLRQYVMSLARGGVAQDETAVAAAVVASAGRRARGNGTHQSLSPRTGRQASADA
jgi:hypothetical protein